MTWMGCTATVLKVSEELDTRSVHSSCETLEDNGEGSERKNIALQ